MNSDPSDYPDVNLDTYEVFKIVEVAFLLKISANTVRRDIRQGLLRAENYGSPLRPMYRISRAAIAEWRQRAVSIQLAK